MARSRKVRTGPEPVTVGESNSHLGVTLKRSRWEMIGWHTFRHSFASNCAARGVDERLIDGWMGHQTEATKRPCRRNARLHRRFLPPKRLSSKPPADSKAPRVQKRKLPLPHQRRL